LIDSNRVEGQRGRGPEVLSLGEKERGERNGNLSLVSKKGTDISISKGESRSTLQVRKSGVEGGARGLMAW